MLTRMQSRLVDCDTVVLQHVQQRGLAGVVEPEEEDLCALVVQAEVSKGAVQPVDKEHGSQGNGVGRKLGRQTRTMRWASWWRAVWPSKIEAPKLRRLI